jgi:hypothetical protein
MGTGRRYRADPDRDSVVGRGDRLARRLQGRIFRTDRPRAWAATAARAGSAVIAGAVRGRHAARFSVPGVEPASGCRHLLPDLLRPEPRCRRTDRRDAGDERAILHGTDRRGGWTASLFSPYSVQRRWRVRNGGGRMRHAIVDEGRQCAAT